MNECLLTKQKINEQQTIKIEGRNISKNWYDKICWYNKIGQPTMKQCLNTYNLFEQYHKEVTNHMTTIKKVSLTMSKEYFETLNYLMNQENQESIKTYSKTRECLNIEKHLTIMKQVIQSFMDKNSLNLDMLSNTKIPPEDWKQTIEMVSYYTQDFNHAPKHKVDKQPTNNFKFWVESLTTKKLIKEF